MASSFDDYHLSADGEQIVRERIKRGDMIRDVVKLLTKTEEQDRLPPPSRLAGSTPWGVSGHLQRRIIRALI